MALVKLVEVVNEGDTFTSTSEAAFKLQEIYINPDHVTHMRAEPSYSRLLSEGKLPTGVSKNAVFTRISIAAGSSLTTVVVIGAQRALLEKMNGKTVIKG